MMAFTFRSSYVPLSEEDCTDSRIHIGAEMSEVDPTRKKHQPTLSVVDIEHPNPNRRSSSRIERLGCLKSSFKAQLLLFLVCVATLGLFARNFLPCGTHPAATGARLSNRDQNAQPAVEQIFISHAKQSSSPVLEVFQVYQPVLTPSGPTDQTINSNGLSNTTTIGSPETSASCTQLLMDYSFGFSYGHPFVGMLFRAERQI